MSSIQAQVFERQILASTDDAEEKHDGSYVTTSSSDLELMYDSWNDQELQTIGLRFDQIDIPANADIVNAYIQFTADGSYSGDLDLLIKGEFSGSSISFANSFENVSSRVQTMASVSWDEVPSWSDEQAGLAQRSPDLSTIVAEVMSHPDWLSGNPLTFIVTGNGNASQKRRAYSFDENASKSALLHIEYASNSQVDLALSNLLWPSSVLYPNSAVPVRVNISSFGNQVAENYQLNLYLNEELITTEAGTETIALGESLVFEFSQTIDMSEEGTYNLEVEVLIEEDEELSNNVLSMDLEVLPELTPLLFGQGSSWKYWDFSANPGDNWYQTDFDDTNWPVGLGKFGHGHGDEQTLLTQGVLSLYFRKKLNIENLQDIGSLYLHMQHDDAAIVYVNGQEVMRTELMTLGSIGHGTQARQRINHDIQDQFFTYRIEPDLFHEGENTIAISVRDRITSVDVGFDAYITSAYSYDYDGPYVFYEGDSVVVEMVTPTGLQRDVYASTDGLELSCQLPHMGTSFSFQLQDNLEIEPSVFPDVPSKFLAISDFDGHIEGFSMLLRGEGIIDENFEWIYGDGHLIISGDLFDRGYHITECMWLLYKLETEAEAVGGKVHLIIGNHEMFNLRDDWRYVEVKYFNDAHLMGRRMIELYGVDTELGRWMRSKNIIEKIGNHAFMHGGLSPQLGALNLSLEQMNEYGRMEMNGQNCPNSACDLVNGGDGVYWYRGMVDQEMSQAQVDNILDELEIGRVILGHTKDETIRSLYNGRVIAIDMYHIDNFENGFMEALQFELGCFYLFHTDGESQNYTLINDCDDLGVGLLEINGQGQLQVYPNPSIGELNMEIPSDLVQGACYAIHDMNGRLMAEGEVQKGLFQIDISHCDTGKYVLSLQGAEKLIRGHFILSK